MMSDSPERGDNTRLGEPEDMLAVVERIRSVPRVRPGAAFRFRMSLYSRLPSLGYRMVNRHEASLIERRILGGEYSRRPGWALSAGRIAAAVALIVVLAVGAFGALTIAARNTNPGDALYSVKRFSEDLELAFTWDRAGRVEKSLLLAEERLSELDYLISRKELDASRLAEVAGDYSDRTRTVEDILLEDKGLENAHEVAAQLKVVRSAEKKIERRLAAAGAVATLAPADGARVTVRDTSGRKPFNGRDYYSARAGADGKLSFAADLPGSRSAGDLEVSVELDGRAEILPVYQLQPAAGGALAASVTPSPEALVLNRPEMFTLALTSSTGTRVGGLSLRLKDVSGTSYVNGGAGEAALMTDAAGRCSFTVEKRSLERVSRISARVVDGPAQDLGEVLVLGGLTAPRTSGAELDGVTARASGPAGGPQAIEMENGLVRISVAPTSTPVAIIDSLTRIGGSGVAGPLYEPASRAPADAGVSSSGPRLVSSGPTSAGYEVSFEISSGDATVRKTYRVTLAKGSPFAAIECRVEVKGAPGAEAVPRLDDVSLLELPDGSAVDASGKTVVPSAAETELVKFQADEPYAAFESGGSHVLLACPLDSETYPDAWVIDASGISFRLPAGTVSDGTDLTFTAILGVTDRAGAAGLQSAALRGIGDVTAAAAGGSANEGFLVTASPSVQEFREGEQYVTLGIYKRYQKVFED